MVAEFGHRISLRPKVACRYHFPKRHGIGRTDNRGCRIEYGSSENKVEGGGNISHLVTGGSMAFHGLKHWCGTEIHRCIDLRDFRGKFSGRLRVATIPVARSVISHQQRRPVD